MCPLEKERRSPFLLSFVSSCSGQYLSSDADLLANEAAIREILIQAQGETALEQFLRQVRL